MLHDRPVAKTDVSRRLGSSTLERYNHLHPFPFFPPPDEEEGRHLSRPEQKLGREKFSEDTNLSLDNYLIYR